VDWLGLLRDGLFCFFAIALIIYVAQCFIYEEQIRRLKERDEELEKENKALRDILCKMDKLSEEEQRDEPEEVPSDTRRET